MKRGDTVRLGPYLRRMLGTETARVLSKPRDGGKGTLPSDGPMVKIRANDGGMIAIVQVREIEGVI